MPVPSGDGTDEYEISFGDYTAQVTTRGAALRKLTFRGRDLVVPFAVAGPIPDYRGIIAAPWPNRIANGRYRFDGVEHMVPLNEPERACSLHGLVFDAVWQLVQSDGSSLALAVDIKPTAGYPYDLRLEASYRAGEDGLNWEVLATNTGTVVAPYGVCPHPYLLAGPSLLDEWELELPADSLTPPALFPATPTFEGYAAVLQQQMPFLLTSLILGAGTVILTVAVAAPAAYALAKLRPRGTSLLNFLMLIAQMIPAIIIAMGFYAIYLNLGVLNTLPGLIIADSTIAVPFAVLIFTAFMAGIPDELLNAAKIDGASHWRTFRSIVMPISRNSVVTVSLFAFLWAWSDFIFASTLNNGGALRPITLGIYSYIGNNNQQWNAIMATAVVASIPAAVLLVIAQKYVSAGVTAGAVKD